VTVRFRIRDIFVALEIGSRRVLHFNVTEHPTSEWTLTSFCCTIGIRRSRPVWMKRSIAGASTYCDHRFLAHRQCSLRTADWQRTSRNARTISSH
jgi:hypothetical protein